MLAEVVGWIGAVTLVLAYGLVSYGYVGSSGVIYQSLNLIGSALLIVNTAWHGAWPSSALNVIWAAIAVGILARVPRRIGETAAPGDPSRSEGPELRPTHDANITKS